MSPLRTAEARRLRILLAVYEICEGRTSESVKTDDVYERVGKSLSTDRDSIEDDLSLLMDRRLLNGFNSLAGLNDVFLTPSGKSMAEEFAATREDRAARLRQLQDDYLNWLYEEMEAGDRSPTPTDYLATEPTFHGSPYTTSELEKAGQRLAEGAFISGQSAWQYKGPLRPKLTAKGRHAIEGGRSVHEFEAGVAPAVHNTFSTTVHGSANIANASSNVTQELHHADWAPRVEAVLDAISQALAALPEATAHAVVPLVDEARTAVGSGNVSRTQRAMLAIGNFLSDTSAGALGSVLGVQALALLDLLGG